MPGARLPMRKLREMLRLAYTGVDLPDRRRRTQLNAIPPTTDIINRRSVFVTLAARNVRSWDNAPLCDATLVATHESAGGPRLPNRYQTAADAIGWKAADMRQFVASRPQLGYVRMVHGQVEIVATAE